MKTDRELLELAAKAAGKELLGWDYQELIGGFIYAPEHLVPMFWSPLTNDGDALRLAMKLGLLIDCTSQCARTLEDSLSWFDGDSEGDEEAATRRAIVRAAAALGEQMP